MTSQFVRIQPFKNVWLRRLSETVNIPTSQTVAKTKRDGSIWMAVLTWLFQRLKGEIKSFSRAESFFKNIWKLSNIYVKFIREFVKMEWYLQYLWLKHNLMFERNWFQLAYNAVLNFHEKLTYDIVFIYTSFNHHEKWVRYLSSHITKIFECIFSFGNTFSSFTDKLREILICKLCKFTWCSIKILKAIHLMFAFDFKFNGTIL